MRSFFASLKPSLIALVFLTLLLGVVYPLFMCCVGQLFFHRSANGTLLVDSNMQVIGSELIAQKFTRPEYFHPRPSSAGEDGYDAASSSGSNLGPTSRKLADDLARRAAAYRAENRLTLQDIIPIDAIAASGSGLDPHISVANALLQAPRVAAARGLSEEELKKRIDQYTQGPALGLFGEKRINVLLLNLSLDKKSP